MILMFFLIMASAWMLTMVYRRYALHRQILDIPNRRSAHLVPVPRGGGIAIVISFLVGMYVQPVTGMSHPVLQPLLVSASVFVALLSFMDDHGHVGVQWRLLVQGMASGMALYALGGFPALRCFDWVLPAGPIAFMFGLLYIVWCINLYNFMDGIDGLAALEALTVCFGAIILYACHSETQFIAQPLMLAAAILGFLYWNWPPARIFMGDVGSSFLGFWVAILSLEAAHLHPHYFWSWLILLGVFVVDATLTLVCRMIRLEKIYQPHATHAYQHAARALKSHKRVSMAVVWINLLWLWPMAWLASWVDDHGVFMVVLAYLPLVFIATRLRAGRPS